jgi:hypothetical protein
LKKRIVMSPHQPDFQAAETFLSLISETFTPTFQYFSEDQERKSPPGHFTAPFERVKNLLSTKNAKEGCGIYVMVNEGDGKGRKEENVTRVNALFVDLDGAPLDPILQAPLKPHVITNTSPGRYQAFWLIKNCPLDAFKRAQIALALKFNGDIKVQDLSRVMRLPGFYNNKPGKGGHIVTIQDAEYALPYDFQTFWEEMALTTTENDLLSEEKDKLPSLQEMLERTIPDGQRNSTLMRYAGRYVFQGASEEMVLGILQTINTTCCKPPLPLVEVASIARSAMTYAVPKVDFSAFISKALLREEEETPSPQEHPSLSTPRHHFPLDNQRRPQTAAPLLPGRSSGFRGSPQGT